jgi:hypothetical protein
VVAEGVVPALTFELVSLAHATDSLAFDLVSLAFEVVSLAGCSGLAFARVVVDIVMGTSSFVVMGKWRSGGGVLVTRTSAGAAWAHGASRSEPCARSNAHGSTWCARRCEPRVSTVVVERLFDSSRLAPCLDARHLDSTVDLRARARATCRVVVAQGRARSSTRRPRWCCSV